MTKEPEWNLAAWIFLRRYYYAEPYVIDRPEIPVIARIIRKVKTERMSFEDARAYATSELGNAVMGHSLANHLVPERVA